MIKNFLTRLSIAAVDLFYPPHCCLCDVELTGEEKIVCSDCLKRLPLISGPRCPKCSRPIRTKGGEDILCGICRIAPNKYLNKIIAAGEYHGDLKRLIHIYKYDRQQFLAGLFAKIIADKLINEKSVKNFDLIVPIPLHWTRKRWRGFNQAREISESLRKLTGIPVAHPSTFKRVKKTTPQVQLNASSRAVNIHDAFKVYKPNIFKNKNIVLVDDVYTTGATSSECSRILIKSGAETVSLIVIAR